MTFPHHPHLNKLIAHHSRSPEALGPYWQPGRKIVEGLLDAVPFPVKPEPPSELFLASSTYTCASIAEPELDGGDDSAAWDPSSAVRLKEEDGRPWLMTKRFTLSTLAGYLRTWSALHAYHEAYPEDAARKGQGPEDGDIVDRLLGRLEIEMGQAVGQAQLGDFEVGWPLVVMMIKKKP
jgi:hypothetical protein